MVSKDEEFVCGRSRVLHNFKLPSLKWGSRKVMRCMKVDDGAFPVTERCLRSFTGRRVSFRFSPQEESGFGRKSDSDAGIEDLMFDFPAAAEKRRRNEGETMKPWNLRTRRARLEPEVREIEMSKLNSNSNLKSRARGKERESFSPWCLRGGGEKRERERAKFSVSLSKEEIEEDFLAITGNRVPRRPKKRPKNVQKQLDMLFPGLWLSEVTADLYKVPDVMENGKAIH